MLGSAACLAAASRAGAVLLLGSIAAVVVVASRGRRLLAVAGVTVFVGALLAAALLWGTLGTRVRDTVLSGGQDLRASTRWAVAGSLTQMVVDHPVFGIGFGAFRVVFPRYLSSGEADLWNQAHDDWAEMTVEGGLVALGCTLWLAVAFWRRVRAVWSGASSRGFRLTLLGLLLGIGSLTLHALVDFNHQIPANALLFVVASALALSPERRLEGSRASGEGRAAGRVLAAVLVAFFGWQAFRGVLAGLDYSAGRELPAPGT